MLKGIILKDYYPKIGMRQMADNDIFVTTEKRKQVHEIMRKLGYTSFQYNVTNHDVYIKEPVSNFEIHTQLFKKSEVPIIYSYYKRIHEKLIKNNNTYEMKLSWENLYIYIISHEYKHFILYGTGLRSLIDTYVMINNMPSGVDLKYVHEELKKLKISKFEKKNKELAMKVLGSEKLTKENQRLLDYYIFSGTYGSFSNGIKRKLLLSKHCPFVFKILYILRRVFPSINYIKTSYPFVYEHWFMIPPFVIYRFINCIFSRPKKVVLELKTIIRA